MVPGYWREAANPDASPEPGGNPPGVRSAVLGGTRQPVPGASAGAGDAAETAKAMVAKAAARGRPRRRRTVGRACFARPSPCIIPASIGTCFLVLRLPPFRADGR